MRSILDKALAALLEGKREEADKLFHDFVLERASQVNESIVETGDVSVEEIVGEEEESVEEGKTFKRGKDEDEDTSDKKKQDQQRKDAAKNKRALGESDEEVAADGEQVEEGKLEITQDEDGTLSMTHEVSTAPDAVDVPVVAPMEVPAIEPMLDTVGEPLPGVEDLNDDEAFESLRESLADELEKVILGTKDGDYAVGGNAKGEKHSPVPNVEGSKRVDGAKAAEIKGDEHNGFDIETAPKSEGPTSTRNVMQHATDSSKESTQEGDSKALLNQIGDDKTAKSPIAGK
jgi:hypothetical protein